MVAALEQMQEFRRDGAKWADRANEYNFLYYTASRFLDHCSEEARQLVYETARVRGVWAGSGL